MRAASLRVCHGRCPKLRPNREPPCLNTPFGQPCACCWAHALREHEHAGHGELGTKPFWKPTASVLRARQRPNARGLRCLGPASVYPARRSGMVVGCATGARARNHTLC